MNIYYVRTRLQALIVEQIVKKKSFQVNMVVFVYQSSRREDSEGVYQVYSRLSSKCNFDYHMVAAEGILKNVIIITFLNFIAFLSRGMVCIAGVDNYQFATAYKIFPFVRLCSFDDGSANFLRHSKYYVEKPKSGRGVGSAVLRILFPKGCAFYLRNKIYRHYTIFPGFSNIVSSDKLIFLKWDWTLLLEHSDLDKIPEGASIVVLGTPYHDYKNRERLESIAKKLLLEADLYIAHPREKKVMDAEIVQSFKSPAESLLKHLSVKGGVKVYHFNSTVAYSLSAEKSIEFVDVTEVAGDAI